MKTDNKYIKLLSITTFINMSGAGVMTSTYTIYMIRCLHYSPSAVGWILGLGPLLGALLSVHAGRLVDANGPWFPLWSSNALFGFLMLSLTVFTNPYAVALIMLIGGGALSFNQPSRSTYIVGVSSKSELVKNRIILRTWSRCGIGCGALLGAFVAYLDKSELYIAAIAINSLSSFFASALLYRLPKKMKGISDRREVATDGGRMSIFRDLRYMSFTILSEIALISGISMDSGLSVWLSTNSEGLFWIYPLLGIATMVGSVFLQSKISGYAEGGGINYKIRGIIVCVIAVCCISLVPLSLHVSNYLVPVILISLAFIFNICEIFIYCRVLEFSYSLRREGMQGEYQGFESASSGIAAFLFTPLIISICGNGSANGWLLLSVVALVLYLLTIFFPYIIHNRPSGVSDSLIVP